MRQLLQILSELTDVADEFIHCIGGGQQHAAFRGQHEVAVRIAGEELEGRANAVLIGSGNGDQRVAFGNIVADGSHGHFIGQTPKVSVATASVSSPF